MIDFPAAPVAGQIFFASNGAVYQYNSTYTSWIQIASTVLNDATFYVEGSGALWAPSAISTWETANPGTIRNGNIGGWYNTTTGVFTPPAGRYLLFGSCTFNSSASSLQGQLRWRKNGAVILTNFDTAVHTPGATSYGTVQNQAIVDANGTDTFDLQVQSTVLMSNAWGYIGAFPLSQAAQIPGGGSSWRQIARTVIAAPQATLDFQNIPADINDIMVALDISPATDDVNLLMRFYDGAGALLSGGNYLHQIAVTNNNQALGAAPLVTTSTSGGIVTAIVLNYDQATNRIDNTALGGWAGTVRMSNIRDAARGKRANWECTYTNGAFTISIGGNGSGLYNAVTAISGLRFLFSSGNIASGVATLWGSP